MCKNALFYKNPFCHIVGESLTQLITVGMSFLKNRDQLAQEYGVSRPTFYRMLERAGIALPVRVQLSPADLEMVYEKLGRPPQENKKQYKH
jgi:hypothetical protein